MTRPSLRPATRAERQLATLWGIAAIASALLKPVWIAVAPRLRPCTFRELTGIPCPSCGTTRTALALLDLDLAGAVLVSPLAAVVGIAFFIGGAAALVWAASRLPLPSLGLRWSRWWTAAVVAAVIGNWAYLIVNR